MTGARRRALGQHFLRDPRAAATIIDLADPTRADLVLEIGAGEGALTGELTRRAGQVVALEVDPELARRLRARYPGVDVQDADARTWAYGGLARPIGGRVIVVGNLPYSVGTAILRSLMEARGVIDRMVLMLQREVAERVAAPPGSKAYGSLSVLTQLHADVRVALRVPPGSFRPPPKVDSAVIEVVPLPIPRVDVGDERRFRAVVLAAFNQRRKMLGNALAAGLGLPLATTRERASRAGVDPTRRAETLTIQEFADLASRL